MRTRGTAPTAPAALSPGRRVQNKTVSREAFALHPAHRQLKTSPKLNYICRRGRLAYFFTSERSLAPSMGEPE